MQLHRRVLALFGLGTLAAFGLCCLWTTSAVAARSVMGLKSYAAVPLGSEGVPAAAQSVSLAAVPDTSTPPRRVKKGSGAGSALSSDSPRALQVAQWQVSGSVVALDGLPLSGHSIRLGADAPGVERTRSDAAGRFAMGVPARADVLVAGAPGFVTVASTRARLGHRGLVVALPARGYTVSVGDARTGMPLTAARVTPIPSDALYARLESTRLEQAPGVAFVNGAMASVSTSRTGLAAFDALPAPEWIDALVTRPGYADQRVSFAAVAGGSLGVWLEPKGNGGEWSGRVVDAEGLPLSSAWVSLGSVTVRAAGDGSFSLPTVETPGGSLVLDAFHPSRGAARIELTEAPIAPIEVLIPKATEPLWLRLVSRTASGEIEPVNGARVLPQGVDGSADFLCPFWRAGQTDESGAVQLPALMEGATMVAYSKGGTELGRFVLRPGEVELPAR